jgi:hypothetical protein
MAAALLYGPSGMKEDPMSTMVKVWGRVHTAVATESLLPWVLGANLILLAGLEWHQGLPVWLKTAAALFLVF